MSKFKAILAAVCLAAGLWCSAPPWAEAGGDLTVEEFGKLCTTDRDSCEPLVKQRTKIIDRPKVARIDHSDDQHALVAAERNRLIPTAGVLGEKRSQGRVASLRAMTIANAFRFHRSTRNSQLPRGDRLCSSPRSTH